MAKFQKGQSGNPKGRAKDKDVEDVKLLAKARTTEAIERLVFWMQSDNPKASVTAANAILDRAYGKPSQHMEHSGSIALIDELREARERAGIAEPVTTTH